MGKGKPNRGVLKNAETCGIKTKPGTTVTNTEKATKETSHQKKITGWHCGRWEKKNLEQGG